MKRNLLTAALIAAIVPLSSAQAGFSDFLKEVDSFARSLDANTQQPQPVQQAQQPRQSQQRQHQPNHQNKKRVAKTLAALGAAGVAGTAAAASAGKAQSCPQLQNRLLNELHADPKAVKEAMKGAAKHGRQCLVSSNDFVSLIPAAKLAELYENKVSLQDIFEGGGKPLDVVLEKQPNNEVYAKISVKSGFDPFSGADAECTEDGTYVDDPKNKAISYCPYGVGYVYRIDQNQLDYRYMGGEKDYLAAKAVADEKAANAEKEKQTVLSSPPCQNLKKVLLEERKVDEDNLDALMDQAKLFEGQCKIPTTASNLELVNPFEGMKEGEDKVVDLTPIFLPGAPDDKAFSVQVIAKPGTTPYIDVHSSKDNPLSNDETACEESPDPDQGIDSLVPGVSFCRTDSMTLALRYNMNPDEKKFWSIYLISMRSPEYQEAARIAQAKQKFPKGCLNAAQKAANENSQYLTEPKVLDMMMKSGVRGNKHKCSIPADLNSMKAFLGSSQSNGELQARFALFRKLSGIRSPNFGISSEGVVISDSLLASSKPFTEGFFRCMRNLQKTGDSFYCSTPDGLKLKKRDGGWVLLTEQAVEKEKAEAALAQAQAQERAQLAVVPQAVNTQAVPAAEDRSNREEFKAKVRDQAEAVKQQAAQSKEQLQAMREGYEKQIEMYRTQLENLQKQFAAQAQ